MIMDSQFKRTQVVMLPTQKAENSLKGYTDRSLLFNYQNKYITIEAEKGYTNHFHLYFLSDDKINEGDWMYNSINDSVIRAGNDIFTNMKGVDGSYCKKIIATTDSSLIIKLYSHESQDLMKISVYKDIKLPQPSEEFINKYVKEYNKGNQLTEVLVEYEQISEAPKMAFSHYTEEELRDFVDHPPKWIEKEILKVDKDNTITIKK